MGTTADKLAYLNDTKTAIKNAIVAKGVDVPGGTTFREYATLISAISGGGGGGGSIDYFQGEVESVAVDEYINLFTITLPIESSKNVFALVGNPDFWDTSPETSLSGTISFANGETYGPEANSMGLRIIRNSAESVIKGATNLISKVKYFVFAVSG